MAQNVAGRAANCKAPPPPVPPSRRAGLSVIMQARHPYVASAAREAFYKSPIYFLTTFLKFWVHGGPTVTAIETALD